MTISRLFLFELRFRLFFIFMVFSICTIFLSLLSCTFRLLYKFFHRNFGYPDNSFYWNFSKNLCFFFLLKFITTYVYASKSPVLMLSMSCSVILMISWRRAGIVNRLLINENRTIGMPDRSTKKINKTIRAHTDTSYGTTITCTNLYQLLRPTPKTLLLIKIRIYHTSKCHPLESSQKSKNDITFAHHIQQSLPFSLIKKFYHSIRLQWHAIFKWSWTDT